MNYEANVNGYRVFYRDDLPDAVRGIVSTEKWCELPVIVINGRLPEVEQLKVLRHELQHIERGDLYRTDVTIQEIEGSMDW